MTPAPEQLADDAPFNPDHMIFARIVEGPDARGGYIYSGNSHQRRKQRRADERRAAVIAALEDAP